MKQVLLLMAIYALILNQSKKTKERTYPVRQEPPKESRQTTSPQGHKIAIASGFRYGIVSYISHYGPLYLGNIGANQP